MLIVAVAFAAGCKKDPAEPNGGGSSLTEEGIYLGVIGFNDNLYTKEIGLLKNSTTNDYKTFINNLTPANGTALYYADYVALDKLKSSQEPPKLTNVVMVTFTDGLDNVSIGPSLPNPGNYNTDEEYRNALHNKIKNDIVHGKHINAYTIGLKGLDAQADLATFRANLKKLASDDNNVYEADNMNQALESFAEIAESLHSVSTTSKLMLKIPGGYNSGIQIRFTFDNVTSVENSNLYIEATYTKNASGLVLNNIVYHGFRNGATSLASVGVEGSYYQIMFENLTKTNGNLLSPNDINRIKLWKNNSSNWVPETEFTPNGSTQVIEEQSSALIMLVLDCTRSLGDDDFANMKTAAKRFVETLVTSTGGGGTGGGTQIINFETGDFSQCDWTNPSSHPWVVTNSNHYEGNFCMMSGNKNIGNSTSTIYMTTVFTDNGSVKFNAKISSEPNYDKGKFYIDDVLKMEISGNGSWVEKTFNVTAGQHQLRWTYEKDSSVDSNNDRLYIDNIILSGIR